MTTIIYCEQCGEDEAYSFSGHAALCSDCFSDGAREALQNAGLGHFCGTFVWRPNNQPALCLEPYGTEHEHG
jgi:hypothetical protein